ncbi:MAG: DISARM system phospholipase D-like protein DrmC [Phycisphaerales bacterium]
MESPVAHLIVEVARRLPATTLRAVIASLTTISLAEMSWRQDSITITAGDATSRDLLARLLRMWAQSSREPNVLAEHLEVALGAVEAERTAQQISLVWTGPQLPGRTLRQTEQALLEVIETARQELWIVTFAAYRVASVVAALQSAVRRGVRLWLVAESADASDGKLTFDAAAALGDEVRKSATVLAWPRDQRPVDAAGRTGSLHAKCALADDRLAFVSSANLTEYALHLNIELGVVIEDGPVPAALGNHFRNLLRMGYWRPEGS